VAFRLGGRLFAGAVFFYALTIKRPYKDAWPVVEAVAEIDRQRGHQFDPALVDAFLRIIERSESSP
jgi:putative two-component system response regulator